VRVTIRPKALVATAFSAVGALVCMGAYFHNYSHTFLGIAFAAEGFLIVTCAFLWRLDRPRQVLIKGRLPEPPVIHGV